MTVRSAHGKRETTRCMVCGLAITAGGGESIARWNDHVRGNSDDPAGTL